MSFDAQPEDIKKILQAQQQQITRLSEMISGLSEAVLASTSLSGKVHDHAVGQAAAFQVFAEILLAASPELRRNVHVAMERILANPDTSRNEHLRAVAEALLKASTDPSRSPPANRPDLRIVPPSEPPQEPGEDA